MLYRKNKIQKNLYERVYLQKCSKTYQSHPVLRYFPCSGRGDRGDLGQGKRMDTSKSLTLLAFEQCCLWSIYW